MRPHHVKEVFAHDVGIRFNDQERDDVEEYCISEGWIKVPAGKTLDRKGRPLMLLSRVECYLRAVIAGTGIRGGNGYR